MDQIRYGVFLRPDPQTSAAVTAVTLAVRGQYGFVSAGAFPPHVTLAGTLPIGVDESELVQRLGDGLAAVPAFAVQNLGVRRLRLGVIYDVHELDGVPNTALVDLAVRVEGLVAPVVRTGPGLWSDRYLPERWHGHLSLASHEMDERTDLGAEVREFISGLDVRPPREFRAELVQLYRFAHPSWTGPWWQTMTWTHVRSWPLGPTATGHGRQASG